MRQTAAITKTCYDNAPLLELLDMVVFAKRLTPGNCIEKISTTMNKVMLIHDMLDATPQGKECKADWDAKRKYAHGHLSEAWGSLGAALNELMVSKRWPTWDEQIEIREETQRKHLATLRAEVERLKEALTMAEMRTTAAEMAAARHTQPQEGEDLAHKVRRAVMSAVHPDKAVDAAEGKWRTRLCQTLFPEIDRIVKRV